MVVMALAVPSMFSVVLASSDTLQAPTVVTLNYRHFLTLHDEMSRLYNLDLYTSSNGMRGEKLSPINPLLRQRKPTVT